MYMIGELCRRCGISRTSLLYYEAQGLLTPLRRTAAGYREYGPKELERLERICAWRASGLPLATIASLLAGGGARSAIDQRLLSIQREMANLREQQVVLLRLRDGKQGGKRMDKARWTALLRSVGLDDAAMTRWHQLFEQQAPEEHAEFLRGLGLPEEEVERIRARMKTSGPDPRV